jgi:hypothetical protein
MRHSPEQTFRAKVLVEITANRLNHSQITEDLCDIQLHASSTSARRPIPCKLHLLVLNGAPFEAANATIDGSNTPYLALGEFRSPLGPLLTSLDTFEDIDELDLHVSVVLMVGLEHLNQLQENGHNILKLTMHNGEEMSQMCLTWSAMEVPLSAWLLTCVRIP